MPLIYARYLTTTLSRSPTLTTQNTWPLLSMPIAKSLNCARTRLSLPFDRFRCRRRVIVDLLSTCHVSDPPIPVLSDRPTFLHPPFRSAVVEYGADSSLCGPCYTVLHTACIGDSPLAHVGCWCYAVLDSRPCGTGAPKQGSWNRPPNLPCLCYG